MYFINTINTILMFFHQMHLLDQPCKQLESLQHLRIESLIKL